MKQTEITSPCELLDKKGRLARPGFARHLYYEYDKKRIKASPLCVKEWDFYQINCGEYVLQLTIGHVSYCSSVSANLFSLKSGERLSVGIMKAFPHALKRRMDNNGEKPYVLEESGKNFLIRFDVKDDVRVLTLSSHDNRGDAKAELVLSNCSPEKEKTVIATPFFKPHEFYLNYKENCYDVTGYADFFGKHVQFGKDEPAYGLLDWGRGVWPFEHEWTWGNGSTLLNGKHFGFNIGWGFGDLSHATENMFFYDNKAYKLGTVKSEILSDGAKRYRDEDGLFDFTAKPLFDNYTTTKLLFVDNSCHQVFGTWQGTAKLPDGTILEAEPFVAFAEEAKNRW